MSNEKKATQAADMICQAISIAENSNAYFKERKAHPIFMMTLNMGGEMCDLLKAQGEATEWSYDLYHIKGLLESLLVSLGKPGVLEQLRKNEQDKASERLQQLIEFFHALSNDDKFHAFLDFVQMMNCGPDDEYIERVNDFYDFSKRVDTFTFFQDMSARKKRE